MTKKRCSVFRPQIMQRKHIHIFIITQHNTNVLTWGEFRNRYWWYNPEFLSQLSCFLACSPPFCIAIGWRSATPGPKLQAAPLCLMACDHPSSSWSCSRGFQWGSGLEIGLTTGSWSGGPFNIKSKVWLRQWVGPDMCCLTPIEFKMSKR